MPPSHDLSTPLKFSGVVYLLMLVWYPLTVFAQAPTTRPVEGLGNVVPATYVLTGAKLVLDAKTEIENGMLIVKENAIVYAGPATDVPPGARQIDLTGKTIWPGLIDAYSEVDVESPTGGSPHWNPGITPQRAASATTQLDDNLLGTLRSQGIVAQLIAPRGGQLKGISSVISTDRSDSRTAVLKDKIGLHVSLTTTRSRQQFPGSPMGAVALVRQTLLDTNWYRDAWLAYRADMRLPRPEVNDALESLVDLREHDVPLIIDAADERAFLRADRMAREFGWGCIVRGSGREYRRLDAIAATNRAVLLPVHFPKAPDVSSAESLRLVTLDRLMHWDQAPDNPGRLARAGVPLALTTDRLPDKAKWLSQIRTAVTRGLTRTDALRSVTETPASLLGIDHLLGSLRAGKLASFVVTDGDLFATDTKIIETWVAGVRHRIGPVTDRDLRGKWSFTFQQPDGAQVVVELWILGELPSELKGRMRYGDATEDVGSLKVVDGRLTLRLPGKPFQLEAPLRTTWVVTADAEEATQLLTKVAWPDGSIRDGTAKRVEKYDPAMEKLSDKEAPAADTAQAASESPMGEETAPKDGESQPDEPSPRTALFPPNYPLGAFGRESVPGQPTWVAFQHATIWTCDAQGRLTDATILVREGKIHAIGTDINIPPDALVVDARGKHITPGIIDCHSHIATDGGVNEATQAITAEVRIGDFIDPDDISIYRQLAGGVTAANVLHGSANPIGGQNQVIKMRWGVLPEELKFAGAPPGIKFALGENVKQSNWGEGNSNRYPQTRMGVDEIIHDALQRATEYLSIKQAWQQTGQGLPPRVDLELEALGEVVRGERWVHCHSYRQSEILALLKTCDRFHVRIGSLQHILEGYKVADEMAKRGITGSSFSDWWAYKYEVYDAIPYNGALMHRAGVIVSFNSDDAELGRRLNLEAAKAMKYGNVAAEDALKFVTLNPAKQLRIDDRVGSLRVGKDADLVVWNASPLSIYSRCEQTWVDGRRFFDVEEDRQLQARDRERHAALVRRIISSDAEMLGPGEADDAALIAWPRHDEFCHHSHDDEESHSEDE